MNLRQIFSWLLFLFGLTFLLFSISYPISTWYWSWIIRPPILFDPTIVSAFPVPKILNSNGFYADLQLTNSAAWFPTAQIASVSASPVSSFLLSFPSLKISDISVKVNSTDLKYHPVHFPGSALPGQIGNSVILGHSALPQFYFFGNNFTVFNPLLRLKTNDLVNINFNGLNYTYKINKIFEVTPDRIDVLSQPDNRRELTLITCVPLGTYLRRLVVVGELIN